MIVPESSASWVAVQEAVAKALRELGGDWGPRWCSHGDYADCDSCDFADTRPQEDVMLAEFVVIGSFVRMTDGESQLSLVSAPSQLETHTKGLLFTVLYD